MDAVKQMTFDWSLGRHPELLSGTFYQPLDQTVPHQFFATSMLATPLLRGVLGWEPDAPLGRARLAPQLPPDWPELTVRRLRAGGTSTDVEIRQRWTAAGGERRTTLTTTGPPLTFNFVPDVPAGAREVAVRVNAVDTELGPDGSFEVITGAGTQAGERAEIVVTWEGGLTVSPPRLALQPGQRSTGLRILDFAADPAGWTLSVEGTAGRSYDIALFGTPVRPTVTSGPAGVSDSGPGVVRVRFAEGEARAAATIRLIPRM